MGQNAQVQLNIAGDGPDRSAFQFTAKRFGLEKIVSFRGQIPWPEMSMEFESADVFLFTSLHDSFGSVVLEATAYGLPIITLDIGGAGTFLPSSAAIKITPTTVEATSNAIAKAIIRLRDDLPLRRSMGIAARQFAESMLWDSQSAAMWDIYQRALSRTGVINCREVFSCDAGAALG
jgi:glycosyltransferase involved in cell wall biosynthesis